MEIVNFNLYLNLLISKAYLGITNGILYWWFQLCMNENNYVCEFKMCIQFSTIYVCMLSVKYYVEAINKLCKHIYILPN